MLKKILFLIKILIVSMFWSLIYFSCLRFVFSYFWNFDIFYIENWKIISEFWERGGVIKTGKDISLISMIFLAIPVWLLILIGLSKFKYIKIITFPIQIFDNYKLSKFDPNDSRIVLKNLSQKKENLSIDDMINAKLKQMKLDKKDEKNLEADIIRTTIQEKIKNKK